jgi:choline monooxygenase
VGRAACVAEPGSYFPCDVVGEPMVVARGKDGVLRAFSNVCRHRAALVVDRAGHGSSLRCPYHAWTYGLDGKLLGAPEFEGVEEWDRESVCLAPARVEVWGPYVFVNLDPASPPLAEAFGAIPAEVARLGCDVNRLVFAERRDYRLACNWKVYVDNYLEGYHLHAAHPGLSRLLDYSQYLVETHRYYSCQHAPLRSGQEARALYYWIFPNFMLNVYPDNLSANIILPDGPDHTATIFEWFAYPGGRVAPETIAFSDEIQQEDIRLCEAVQKGLRSRTYDQGRYSVKRESGVHHFHRLLAEFLS